MTSTLAYFPGCSLHGMAKPFDKSMKLVSSRIGINLVEPQDWNCCGATSAHSVDSRLNLVIGARNLHLVAQSGQREVVVPCAACYGNLIKASHDLEDSAKRNFAANILGAKIVPIKVVHVLELFTKAEAFEAIKEKIQRRFKGLKAVCYYGCLTVRPRWETRAADSENPQSMDKLLELLGVDVRDWSHKTECCGGSYSLSEPELANLRTDEILDQAMATGAEVIVVACPMCHSNLEFRLHARSINIPVVFITQLIGLAMGYTVKDVGLNKLLVNSFPWQEKLT